jgi:hypothetical protein
MCSSLMFAYVMALAVSKYQVLQPNTMCIEG